MKRLSCILHKKKLLPQPVVVSTFVLCLPEMCTMHVCVEPILKFIFCTCKLPVISCLHGYQQMLLHVIADDAH